MVDSEVTVVDASCMDSIVADRVVQPEHLCTERE